MNKRGRCVHFNGVQNKVCEVGVMYPQGGLPCFRDGSALHRLEVPDCDKFREPTAEEIAADEASFQASLNRMRIVMTAIRPWRTWTNKNRVAKQEVIECPACKGRLHLSQAAYNGHVHGQCETKGCISWME